MALTSSAEATMSMKTPANAMDATAMKKPYSPPIITDLGDVVEKTLGDANTDIPEENGWYGWLNACVVNDELRRTPRK